jgi:hypothetical protein
MQHLRSADDRRACVLNTSPPEKLGARSGACAKAAAPDKSLKFLLVGAVVLLPMILAYTVYAYWVFRGNVRPTHNYHA